PSSPAPPRAFRRFSGTAKRMSCRRVRHSSRARAPMSNRRSCSGGPTRCSSIWRWTQGWPASGCASRRSCRSSSRRTAPMLPRSCSPTWTPPSVTPSHSRALCSRAGCSTSSVIENRRERAQFVLGQLGVAMLACMADEQVAICWARDAEDVNGAFALREAVFYGEQNVPVEEELDGLDRDAQHLVALDADGRRVVGTLRLL